MRTKNLLFTLINSGDGDNDYNTPLVPNDTWNASAITGIPAAVTASVEAPGPTVKIVSITGNNLNNIAADIFLQIWSFPVTNTDVGGITGYDLTTTGTLVSADANAGATLVYSKRILDNYSFTIDLNGLEVYHGVIAVSSAETTFTHSGLSAAVNVNVEIESNEILPSTYTPPTVDILA